MKIDQNTFRDHESAKSWELDNHLKNSTNTNFLKVKELET